jgi:hypothetical protein
VNMGHPYSVVKSVGGLREESVVSHISPKTSAMWGPYRGKNKCPYPR